MKTLLKLFLATLLFVPITAFATTSVPWSITNTSNSFIFPSLVNGVKKGIIVTASSTINGSLSVSGLTSGNCVQASTGGLLTTTSGACASGSNAFPFTPQSWGNSTSTTLGFLNGFLSTASSTINSNLFLTNLSQGMMYIGSNGLVQAGVATTSVTCSGNTTCTSFTVLGSAPITISSSGGSSSLSTTSPIAAGNVLEYSSTGAGSAFGIATGTLSGTASQINISATAYTLLNGATLSLPNHVIFPVDFFASAGSTTNATTTNFAITGAPATNCNGTSALTTNSSGVVGCTAQPQGTVTSVTATNPIFSTGGATPVISTIFSTTSNWGLGNNGFVITGATGIPFTAASSTLNLPFSALPTVAANSVLGNVTSVAASATSVATSSLFLGTIGQTAYFNNTGGLVGTSSLFIATNSFVGIGTTSPFAALSVSLTNPTFATSTIFAVASSTNGTLNTTQFSVLAGGQITLGEQQPATTTTLVLDWSATQRQVNYRIGTAGVTLTIINATTSQFAGSTKIVWVCNPGSSAGALTWAGVEWVGAAPTQTTTANQCDVYSLDVTHATSSTAYKVAGTQGTGFQ